MTNNRYEVIHNMPLEDLPKLLNADLIVCEMYSSGLTNSYREVYEDDSLMTTYLDFIYDSQRVLQGKLHRMTFPDPTTETLDVRHFYTPDAIVKYSSIDIVGYPEPFALSKLQYSLEALIQIVEGIESHPDVDPSDTFNIAGFCQWFKSEVHYVLNLFEKELQENTLI